VAEIRSAPAERRANLALAYQELLTVIVRLRFGLQSVPDEDTFRTYVKDGLRAAMKDGLARGYTPTDIKLASFALVALLDESILNLKDPVFVRWTGQPLALEITGRQVAGEEFFDYTQQLLGRSDSAEVADLLEVFYLCLLLGYRGKYAFPGAGDLRAFMDTIRDKIVRCRGDSTLLSPQAMLPSEPAPTPPGDPWLRPLAWTAGLAVAVALVIFVLCTIFLNGGLAELRAFAGR
jgi:type VI secretion system protein ImpK